MSEYKDFSSLPPETEREFVVYEKTSVEAGKKAKVISLAVAVGFLAIVMAIVFSFPAPHNLMAEDDMGGLAAPTGKTEGEKPKAEGAAPAADKPAEGAAADKPAEGAAAAEGAADKPAEGAADKPAEGAAAGAEAGKTEGK